MDKCVGVLGGGQLGRMLVEAANRLNIRVKILDQGHGPAKQIAHHGEHVEGSFKDSAAIRKLAAGCDVLTVEIEHVDTAGLEQLEKAVEVEPRWRTIQIIQDKYLQKKHLHDHHVATAESVPLESNTADELRRIGRGLGYPFMLKSRREAYDGRGNFPVKTESDIPAAIAALGSNSLYAERWADFQMELAVMVVKTKDGTVAFPTVETIHESSICKLVYAPARSVSGSVLKRAQELAEKAVAAFEGKGVFGVEMFLLRDQSVLVNEIAPRPHNSGHYTIESCPLSQYDAHLRAILDLPIPAASLRLREPAIMLNILGGLEPDSHVQIAEKALAAPNTSIHLYGKEQARKGRKMGHITVTAPTMAEAEEQMQPLIDAVDDMAGKPLSLFERPKKQPRVAVVMGSDSDLPVLKPAFKILDEFNIPYQTRITSAHRTPDWLREFAKAAEQNGFHVIIAAAGGAAHLPGMFASWTVLPVIGVPVKASSLDGVDSLYSMTQMPRGEPVATVGINNAINAALLAARILGRTDPRIAECVKKHAEESAEEVLAKDLQLLNIGPVEYLKKMGK